MLTNNATALSKDQMKEVRGGLEGFSIWDCAGVTICEPGYDQPNCAPNCTLIELATSCTPNGCGGIVP